MTTLYRVYGDDGRLAYVGVTDDLRRRLCEHQRAPWWPLRPRVETREYEDRAAARAAEIEAIATEWPLRNRHSPWAG